jgi:hypothetical protein
VKAHAISVTIQIISAELMGNVVERDDSGPKTLARGASSQSVGAGSLAIHGSSERANGTRTRRSRLRKGGEAAALALCAIAGEAGIGTNGFFASKTRAC